MTPRCIAWLAQQVDALLVKHCVDDACRTNAACTDIVAMSAHRLNHSSHFCPRFKLLLNNTNLSGSDGHGKNCIIFSVGN